MVGSEQRTPQNMMGSQESSHDFGSCQRMDLYCVEYEQENGVISDLHRMICQQAKKKKVVTHPEED